MDGLRKCTKNDGIERLHIKLHWIYVCVCRQESEQDPTTSDSLCQICMQQNVEVMLSCGHLLCGKCPSKCANPWLRCPFCRANVYNMMALKNVPPGNVVPLYLGMPPEEPRALWVPGVFYYQNDETREPEFIDLDVFMCFVFSDSSASNETRNTV